MMIRFLKERVWAHLPTEVSLRQRLWGSLLWGFVLPLVLASVVMLAVADWKGAAAFGLTYLLEYAAAVWLSQQLGVVGSLLVSVHLVQA